VPFCPVVVCILSKLIVLFLMNEYMLMMMMMMMGPSDSMTSNVGFRLNLLQVAYHIVRTFYEEM